MPRLVVDGKPVDVPAQATVLQAIRRAGIHLPTLCYWEGLPPYGACRLCLVELVQPQQQVIAACAFPVEEGQVVTTRGPQAMAVRRMMLEFLLARCPTSTQIRELAAEAGVVVTRFSSNQAENELCVLCGLCVRVCAELVGAAAISFTNRGGQRGVDSPFHLQSEACIGCGACAAVCPTGAIFIEDRDGTRILHNWNTALPLQPCPNCGLLYAPQSMAFLAQRVETGEETFGVCPECRRKNATERFREVLSLWKA